jgi:transposase
MKSLSTNKINSIIARLDAGQSYENIAAEIGVSKGVITKIRKQHRSDLQLSLGGRPSKLFENDICHTIR